MSIYKHIQSTCMCLYSAQTYLVFLLTTVSLSAVQTVLCAISHPSSPLHYELVYLHHHNFYSNRDRKIFNITCLISYVLYCFCCFGSFLSFFLIFAVDVGDNVDSDTKVLNSNKSFTLISVFPTVSRVQDKCGEKGSDQP